MSLLLHFLFFPNTLRFVNKSNLERNIFQNTYYNIRRRYSFYCGNTNNYNNIIPRLKYSKTFFV